MRMRKSAVSGVTDMLEAQHKALLSGDLDALGSMAEALERAFERLRREGGAKAVLTQIKDAAARNARLLSAAQAGVAAARAHLSSSRSTTLTTYGPDGRSQGGAASASRTLARR